MPSQTPDNTTQGSRWPHRLAWALACGTFPLVWFGGMVTTWKAGMAVPDWPSSFQHWLFLPLAKWFSTWHVVLEHTHREIGKAVGLLTIALMVALLRLDDRRWMRVLGVVALVAVCYQGALGGARVIANEVLLANLHGCTAPLFFALASALVVFTSPAWRMAPGTSTAVPAASRLRGLTVLLPMVIYVQIVLGAQLRHLLPDQSVQLFPWFTVAALAQCRPDCGRPRLAGRGGVGRTAAAGLSPPPHAAVDRPYDRANSAGPGHLDYQVRLARLGRPAAGAMELHCQRRRTGAGPDGDGPRGHRLVDAGDGLVAGPVARRLFPRTT